MSQTDSSAEAPAASLVGSLEVFALSDVLALLSSTVQTGELQVVGSAVDGRLWLEHGELSNAAVGSATTIGEAVFELACVTEGWFYFTAGLVSSSGQPTVPVAAVLDEVRPQVVEWFELRSVVPLDAVVTLAPHPPGDDVQIRGDQWKVLTTVGTGGNTVKDVLDTLDGDQVSGLRALRELADAGLILLEGGTASSLPLPPSFGATSGAGPSALSEEASLADVAVMPPPITGDPWTPSADSAGSEAG
ncbi:MAG: DUF4388 domain-containing protein [Actinomycetota bacterium]|jgi:hypothetical protein|nr:DUF4388 domain-containing protein [Actinomycetota bacterium]MDA8293535.1 DUF4388 domain-containing protein [Actinomycetota bacterium]